MVRHNDAAYVMMLLGMPLSPMSDGALNPLNAEEFSVLAAALYPNTAVRIEDLIRQDIYALQGKMRLDDEFINRLSLLLSRQMILGRLIEDCQDEGTEILTPFDQQYPQGIKKRLGTYQSPVLFVKGNVQLLEAGYIGILGVSGIKTTDAMRRGVERLVNRAAINRFGLVTGAEPGVCRLAAGFALENEGRLVCVLTGGLNEFASDSGHAYAIESGNLLALSAAHPAARAKNTLLPARNRLIFALSRAAFIVTSDGKRSETEALRKRLCDEVYLLTDPALPLNAALKQKGFKETEDLNLLDIDALSKNWSAPEAQQLSFL